MGPFAMSGNRATNEPMALRLDLSKADVNRPFAVELRGPLEPLLQVAKGIRESLRQQLPMHLVVERIDEKKEVIVLDVAPPSMWNGQLAAMLTQAMAPALMLLSKLTPHR